MLPLLVLLMFEMASFFFSANAGLTKLSCFSLQDEYIRLKHAVVCISVVLFLMLNIHRAPVFQGLILLICF